MLGGMRRTPPEIRAEVMRLAGTGRTNLEIATATGIAEATVRKIRKLGHGPAPTEETAAPPARIARNLDPSMSAPAGSVGLPPATPPITPDPPEPALDLDDLEGTLTRFVGDARRNADAAARDGNHTAAQRGMKDAANLLNLLMRARRDRRDQSEGVHVSKDEIAATENTLRDRVRALLERPLVCAKCSREIAIDWGRTVREDIKA